MRLSAPALLLAFLLAVFSIAAPNPASTDNYITDLIADVKPLQWASVNPFTGEGVLGNHCTAGFINRKDNYWLTAAHCVTDWNTGEVIPALYFIDGMPATIVVVDVAHDLAVLQTQGYAAKPLRLAKTNVWWVSEIKMAGYPLGVGPFMVQGRIANPRWPWQDRHYTIYNISGCQGNSGSPVVNMKDELIGVLQVGFGQPCSTLMGGALLSEIRMSVGSYFER